MPRLFPSLGRSKEHRRGGAYGQYEGYDAPQGYYDQGYAEQEPRQNRSPWSKVLHRKSTKRVRPRMLVRPFPKTYIVPIELWDGGSREYPLASHMYHTPETLTNA